MTRILGPRGTTQRRARVGLLTGALAVALAVFTVPAAAKQLGTNQALACATASVLSGSNFEIDTNANLKVDGGGDCIDWLADGTGSALRSGVLVKDDKPTGTSDDSFGIGTKEDDENPTIITGSIPNNKSDLTHFGLYAEVTATGKFLELF